MTDHFPAGAANYPGDQSHIVGEVNGPTTYGTFVIATDATFDADADSTRVAFRHATPDEHAALVARINAARR